MTTSNASPDIPTTDLERGMQVRIRMFGEERLKKAFSSQDDLTQKFQRLMTASCFGAVWGDDAIAWRQRSLITMAILAGQGRAAEFETHVRLALRNGCDAAELEQLVLHITVYCGVPAGGEAFRIVSRVQEEAAAAAP